MLASGLLCRSTRVHSRAVRRTTMMQAFPVSDR